MAAVHGWGDSELSDVGPNENNRILRSLPLGPQPTKSMCHKDLQDQNPFHVDIISPGPVSLTQDLQMDRTQKDYAYGA